MQSHITSAETKGKRAIKLAFLLAGVAVAWLILLPWLAHRPAISDHLHFLDEHKINAGAMYYTELDSMEPILERVNNEQRVRK